MAGGQPQATVGDMSRGHWVGVFYFPPRPLTDGSPDTYSCCKKACRVGDPGSDHFAFIGGIVPFPFFKHSGRKASTGSSTCYINNKQAFRVNDMYNCGDAQAQGCSTNLVGG